MKRLLIIFSTLLISFVSLAQGNEKVKELGVVFSQNDTYGVTYRFGNEHALWRISAVSLSMRKSSIDHTVYGTTTNYGDVRASIGREFRKPIGTHVAFRYGADASLAYGSQNIHLYQHMEDLDYSVSGELKNYSPSVNLILGLSYQIKRFVIGAELQPIFGYRYTSFDSKMDNGEISKSHRNYWYYDFDHSPVVFSAVYQF